MAMMAAIDLPSGSADGPEWVHLLTSAMAGGKVFTADQRGPYIMTAPGDIIAACFAQTDALEVNINHATCVSAPKGERSDAVGWVKEMRTDDKGIWGHVEWTSEGHRLVADKAYRRISPVVMHDAQKRLLSIAKVSLLNRPNLRGLAALNRETPVTFMEQLIAMLAGDRKGGAGRDERGGRMTLNLKAIVSVEAAQAKAELGATATALTGVKTAATGAAGGTNAETVSLRDLATASRTATTGLNAVERGSSAARGNIRMFGQQLSQVAQQGAATGQWAQAFAIQAADIGMSFGAVGMGAGILITLLPTLASSFGMTGDAAKEAKDSLDNLESALSSYNQYAKTATESTATLRGEFGRFAQEMQADAKWLAQVEVGKATAAFAQASSAMEQELLATNRAWLDLTQAQKNYDIAVQNGASTSSAAMQQQAADITYLRAVVDLAAGSFGLTTDQVVKLDGALASMSGAKTMADIAAKSQSALDVIKAMFPAGEAVPPAIQGIVEKLANVHAQAVVGLATMEDMPGALGSATGAANGLAGAMGRVSMVANAALSRMIAMAGRIAQGRVEAVAAGFVGRPEQSPEDMVAARAAANRARAAIILKQNQDALGVSLGSGTGAGGGAGPATDDVQAYIAKLREELDMMQVLDPVQREMIKNRKLLAEASVEQRSAIEDLLAAQQKEANLTDAMKAFGSATYDALSGLIIEGKSASDVMKGLEKAILQAALQALVLGEGPLSGAFGTKGKSLVSLIFGGIFGGKKADGGMIYGAGGARDDKVMIAASAGEFVVNGRAANANRPLLEYLNGGGGGGYANGGTVPGGGGLAGVQDRSPPPVNIHIDARGAQKGVAEEIAARMAAMAPQIGQIAVAAVVQARARGMGV